MAVIRRTGFGTVFEVENEKVGIGTTGNQTNTVQVLGETKTSSALVAGLSTLTTYQGFVNNNAEFGNSNVDINSQSGTLGNIEICHGDFNVSSASTLTSSVNELTVTNSFSVPTGDTDSRIHCHTAGSMRFNQNLGTLEFYTGDEWRTVNSLKDTGNRGRAVFAGGRGSPNPQTPADLTAIEFVNIASFGNAVKFGELITATSRGTAVSSEVRGVFGGGGFPNENNVMEYITIASEGNALDFGDLTGENSGVDRACAAGASSSTRGVFAGGGSYPSAASNIIDYIQISTIGNALDFGDLTVERAGANVATNGKKMLIGTGGSSGGTSIDEILIASKGNAIDFGGDTTYNKFQAAHCSNSVRGVWAGGQMHNPYHLTSAIEFVTIESGGNAIDFGGTLFEGLREPTGACNQVRGIFAGGINPNGVDTIQFVTIASTGDAQDFGNLTEPKRFSGGLSDSHGGLGGY
tara:strand:+ start:992 stop:2383 length:1392 start_codon:yes stop_codon:yes gene_type:complete